MLRSLALTLAFLPFASFAQDTAPSAAAAPAPAPAASEQPAAPAPRVALTTNLGRIVIELDPVKAPKSSENFLQYVRDGFYAGTVFHRVIPGFMAQGGGFTADLQLKPTRAAIPNEANNGLSNLRGTVAMARTNDPHSATAQFFINVVDNQRLDFVSEQDGLWGYAVFGKVVEGMEVVDKIIAIPTGGQGPLPRDVPLEPVLIESAEIVAEAPAAG
ncbi:peptidylprolyl isomerase [Aquimonas voraii]|uniref:Peptidyl-prolyl cis-trans isomerase n=1 Tax=Aquimonas voraii TaxID=265719 RepID=A0A1G6XQL6_9GAMM|nr:peptidyl-prolyl cis-trans isomerase A (cyclophilin A) [Aquimonas voraii]